MQLKLSKSAYPFKLKHLTFLEYQFEIYMVRFSLPLTLCYIDSSFSA